MSKTRSATKKRPSKKNPDLPAAAEPSELADIIPDTDTGRLKVERNLEKLPASLSGFFDQNGLQNAELEPVELFEQLSGSRSKYIRISHRERGG